MPFHFFRKSNSQDPDPTKGPITSSPTPDTKPNHLAAPPPSASPAPEPPARVSDGDSAKEEDPNEAAKARVQARLQERGLRQQQQEQQSSTGGWAPPPEKERGPVGQFFKKLGDAAGGGTALL